MSAVVTAVVAAVVIGAGTAIYSADQNRKAANKQEDAIKEAERKRQAEQAKLESERQKIDKDTETQAVQSAAIQQRKKLAASRGSGRSTMLTDPNATNSANVKGKTLLGQ